MKEYDPIRLGILWNRLISVVEEASVSLTRAAFSEIVRESNDFCCVLCDADGNSVTQSIKSVPSFIGTLPISVRHFLRKYPKETLKEGDAIISNDPWICTGHVGDLTIVTPIFYQGKLVAFAGCIAHSPDMGGVNMAAGARDIYEEGQFIPILKVMEEGKPNETLLEILKANVRVPLRVMGDLYAQLASNDLMGKRLISILKEGEIEDFGQLTQAIISRSEQAMRESIERVPDGIYKAEIETDGYDKLVTIKGAVTVKGSEIKVDYTGTEKQLYCAINTVMNYTYAYTAFPIKCVINPRIPNNQGCFRPISVYAPEGSLLNPTYPAAVGARSQIGHFLHAIVFRALVQAVPDRVQAESGGCPVWSGNFSTLGGGKKKFTHKLVCNGGQGASPHKDGISALSYPSNIANVPIEMTESTTQLRVEEKEFITDSGGDGQFRGGLGQRVVVRLLSEVPAMLRNNCDRTKSPEHAAGGFMGGKPGSIGNVFYNGKRVAQPKERTMIYPGLIVYETPGGGGYGPPERRDRKKIADDLKSGSISPHKAKYVYGYESS